MSTLALFGGSPVISTPFSPYKSIGDNEIEAVAQVMRSGTVSGFYGSWCEGFWGGTKVRAFEQAWSERFRVNHAISLNSATSGIYAAMGAIGISPGDEVIVPPFTMSATVMAPLIYGGIPVFADIEPDTFCLDPTAVQQAISSKTKAIIAVNLFGHPSRLFELKRLAEKHGLFLVEDSAQSPLAEEAGTFAGTIGDIGVFSLNFHKHIHTGEGGICVTDDDNLALRIKLIRNHGENAVEPLEIEDISNMVGFNFRMTELQAAIGIEQLARIDGHVASRQALAEALSEGIGGLEGLVAPYVRPGCRHVYYVWGVRFKEPVVGISREMFSRALKAEGFPHGQGYCKPLYLLPLFQKKIALGAQGFPFRLSPQRSYDKGLCPVCERMYQRELLLFEPCAYDIDKEQIPLLVEAIHKVYKHRKLLGNSPL